MSKTRRQITIAHASAPHEDRLIIKLASTDSSIQGSCTAAEIFPTIKSLTAELFADDWKAANQINRMDREEYTSKYELVFPIHIRDLKDDGNAPRPLRELSYLLNSLQQKSNRQDGIANLVDAIHLQSKEDDNAISALVEKMYDSAFNWNPESQGITKITGKAWGTEFELRATHAVGNWYIEGWIGSMKVRIFRTHSAIQIYLVSMGTGEFDMTRCDAILNVYDKLGFIDWMRTIAKRQSTDK